MRKFVRARDGHKSKILFEKTLKPRELCIHERFDFMKFINLKCDVSFHVWQIILIFGCKLMIFLPFHWERRDILQIIMARVKGISAFLPVYLPDILDHWHRCQRRGRREDQGWQHSFDAIQDLWKVTQAHVAGVFQTGAQIKLGHLEEFSLTRFLNKVFTVWFFHSAIFSMKFKCLLFFKRSNFVLKVIPDYCLFPRIEQKRRLEVFTFSPVLNSICHNGCCERIFE